MISDLTYSLIFIAIIGFFVGIILNVFFVYFPVQRIEDKFDKSIIKLDTTLTTVTKTSSDVEKIIKELEELKQKAEPFIEDAIKFICKIDPTLPICKKTTTTGTSLCEDISNNISENIDEEICNSW